MPAVVTQSDGSTRPITLAVAQPMNTEKATLKGVEAGFQQALDFLPGPLSHLGFQVNYTHIWSDKVVLDQGHPALPLTGISRSEEHTSELQSLMRISYAVFCLKKKKSHNQIT